VRTFERIKILQNGEREDGRICKQLKIRNKKIVWDEKGKALFLHPIPQ
jgi:hypothetical protein